MIGSLLYVALGVALMYQIRRWTGAPLLVWLLLSPLAMPWMAYWFPWPFK